MKFSYDRTTDSLYIHLSDRPGADTRVLSDLVVVDVDRYGNPVGIDIQSASSLIDVSRFELQGFSIADLKFSELVPV